MSAGEMGASNKSNHWARWHTGPNPSTCLGHLILLSDHCSKPAKLHFHIGFRQPQLQPRLRCTGIQHQRRNFIEAAPGGSVPWGTGTDGWNPCSWQQGLVYLPSQSRFGHPLMSTSFSVVSWVSQRGPASWMSDYEFLIMFISNKWIALFFFF